MDSYYTANSNFEKHLCEKQVSFHQLEHLLLTKRKPPSLLTLPVHISLDDSTLRVVPGGTLSIALHGGGGLSLKGVQYLFQAGGI